MLEVISRKKLFEKSKIATKEFRLGLKRFDPKNFSAGLNSLDFQA